jgi:hypothetical protein
MADLQLFRDIRGIRRSVPGKFDKAYAFGGGKTVGSDPYALQSKEFYSELVSRMAAEEAVTFKAFTDVLSNLASWAHGPTLSNADIAAGAETLAASPAIALAEGVDLPSGMDDIDVWLLNQRDAPDATELKAWLTHYLLERKIEPAIDASLQDVARLVVAQLSWQMDRLRIGLAIVIAMHRSNTAEALDSRGTLSRLALVASLIETLAGKTPTPTTGKEIFALLHHRPLVFGTWLLKRKRKASNLARRPGVADLLVIRQKWAKYVLGELTHVEPVMAGEQKKRLYERTNITELNTTTTTSKLQEIDRENRSTLSSEMSAMLSSAAREQAGVEGWLNVDAQMPSTKVSTHVGADYSYSAESQRENSSRRASEIVESVVSRVEESLTSTREQRRSEKIIDRTVHKIANTGTSSMNGIYRWVDRINLVEVVRYPNRFVFEVQIPEPAAWTRWLVKRNTASANVGADPGPFPNALMADAISSDPSSPTYYLDLGRTFGADVLATPPAPLVLAEQIKAPDANEGSAPSANPGDGFYAFGLEASNRVAVPDGYFAHRWKATAMGIPSDFRDPNAAPPRVIIAVGAGAPVRCVAAGPPWLMDQIDGLVGPINRGALPIAVTRHVLLEYLINLEITCLPSAELVARWQMEVLSELRAAHERRRAAVVEERARAEMSRVTLPVATNPIRNREIMIAEIKRLSIEMLSDQRLYGRGGMEYPNPTDAPILNRAAARESAAEIQFIEQTFEWSNLSYAFYPTYWTVESRWPGLLIIEENDPEFAAFLRAGSVRVIIPVRPGFEHQALLFVEYGLIWGGGAAPGPEDEGYHSVAAEIEELQRGSVDGEVIRQWPVTLPTNMVALDEARGFPLANPDVRLP